MFVGNNFLQCTTLVTVTHVKVGISTNQYKWQLQVNMNIIHESTFTTPEYLSSLNIQEIEPQPMYVLKHEILGSI